MSHLVRHGLAVLVIAVGVAAFVYGGADDSPGLQLIGVVLVIGTVVTGLRARRQPGPR